MGRIERLRARQARGQFFRDLVTTLKSVRAAVRRDPGLAVELLAAISFELGVAQERYGENAVVQWLRRAALRTAHKLIHSFEEPTDTSTRIALALFRSGLGERRPPKRAPLRLVDAKAVAP